MNCKQCPNLVNENGTYKCNLFVSLDGSQMLDKHKLKDFVNAGGRPKFCEVDKNGKEIEK